MTYPYLSRILLSILCISILNGCQPGSPPNSQADLATAVYDDTTGNIDPENTENTEEQGGNDLVAISAFESDNKTIRGRIISPAHASANNRDTFTYKIGQNHTISKTFNNVDDYALVLNDDGTFIFTSDLNYLGEVKVPVVVTSATVQNKTIKVSFATEIKQAAFNDPEAHNQWHIHNTGQTNGASEAGTPGHDINIGLLYRQGITGQGVKVAVLDSFTYIDHDDLSENIASENSYDFENQDDDPSPSLDKGSTHGTKVAGIIGAVANNHEGGHGVAPGIILNIFQRPSNLTSKSFKNMIENWLTNVQILNQSFGNPSMNARKTHREPLIDLFKSTHSYNNGRGLFFVKAAGNTFKQDRQLQKNKSSTPAYLPARNSNSTQKNYLFENTVVAAVTADAKQPHATYSSSGANVFISAPGGEDGRSAPAIYTTAYSTSDIDNVDSRPQYTHKMNGTSSSAPIISGVAALIYQVNPDLTWRDVRHIMATTATKIDVNVSEVVFQRTDEVGLDPNSFIAQDTWQTNQAGYAFHPYYGFGMVDATKAVQMAANGYQNLPQLMTTEWIAPKFNDNQQTILENYKGASKNIEVTDNATIESIQIKISITHSRISDLAIVVFSPNGTRSVVMTPRSLLNIEKNNYEKFDQTILLSHAFYGEQAKGTWKVQVVDTNQDDFKYYRYYKCHKKIKNDACNKSSKYYKKSQNIPNNKKLGTFQEVQLKIFGHP